MSAQYMTKTQNLPLFSLICNSIHPIPFTWITLLVLRHMILLAERSEPHTGLFNRDFTCYIYNYIQVKKKAFTMKIKNVRNQEMVTLYFMINKFLKSYILLLFFFKQSFLSHLSLYQLSLP